MPGLNKVLQIKGKKQPNWKTGKNKQTKKKVGNSPKRK